MVTIAAVVLPGAAGDGGQRGEGRACDAEEARLQNEGGGGGGAEAGAGAGIGTGAEIGGGVGEQAATASPPPVTPPEQKEAPARTSSCLSDTSVAGTSSRCSDASLSASSLSLATFNTISAQARKQQASWVRLVKAATKPPEKREFSRSSSRDCSFFSCSSRSQQSSRSSSTPTLRSPRPLASGSDNSSGGGLGKDVSLRSERASDSGLVNRNSVAEGQRFRASLTLKAKTLKVKNSRPPAKKSCSPTRFEDGVSGFSAVVAAANNLKEILCKALKRVGQDDLEKAEGLTAALAELYIRTPDQLRAALDADEVLGQVQLVLKGLLLMAVRAELKTHASAAQWRKGLPSRKAPGTMASPLPRTFEVIRADVTHLSSIDQVSQTFRARLFLILRIAGGADDEHLVKEYDGFPLDTSGVPTFRPSARWYLNQISFSNGRSIETQESKVTVAGNDLQLIKRVEGEFFSRFELHSFPFDAQDLTITISTHCATKGPVPMLYTVPPSSDLGVDTANFAYGDVWELSPSIATEVTTVGATSKRRFCAVHLRACVSRQPNFILLNVVTPMACISLLGVTTFTIDLDDVQDRIAITVALLLTTVSLKYVTSAYVPQISYLTLVDSFVMLNGLLIVFISVAHAVMSLVSNLNSDRDGSSGEDETDKVLKMTDYILLGVAFFLWLSILLRFVVVGKRATNTSSASGQQRESARRRSERLAAKRAQHDVKEELST